MTRYAIAPDASSLDIWTEKEGLLAKVAHDLQIGATGFTGEATAADGRFTLRLVVPVDGLRVRGHVSGGATTPVSEKDRREIEQTMLSAAVLDAAKHAQVVFTAEGEGALLDASGPIEVKGELTIKGVRRPLAAGVRVSPAASGGFEASGAVRFKQSLFGMKPYSAMLGALKVKDEVRVSWSLALKQVDAPAPASAR